MSETAPLPKTSSSKSTAEHVNSWRTRLRKCAPAAALAVLVSSGGFAYREYSQTHDALQAQTAQINSLKAQNDRTNRLLAAELGVDKRLITGTSLAAPDVLPGTGILVRSEERAALQASTVKLGQKRFRGSDGRVMWDGSCTATKVVNTTGNVYMMSAAHCFTDENAGNKKGGTGPLAASGNVPGQEYSVLDGNLTREERLDAKPLALLGDIAVDKSGTTDMALAEVHPTASGADTFNALPALPLDSYLTGSLGGLNSQVTPGQSIALDGMPQSSEDVHVRTTGIYLGQFQPYEITGISNQMDMVAIAAPAFEEDACNYGASGSQGAFTTTDGSLGMFGPLSYRDSIGYGEQREFHSPDDPRRDTINRLKIESMAGVNLDSFNTICGYSTPQQDTIANLEQVLQDPSLVIISEGGK